jgi:S-layer protein
MAAQDYTSVVQQLYVSYFGRPADYYGLQNFSNALAALDTKGELKTFAAVQAAMQADKTGTTGLTKLVNSFNNSAESNALYGTDNTQIGIGKFVNAIYQNVLGRDADLDGFNFWVNAITSGALTKANAAAAITQGALDNKSTQGLLDAQTVSNKLAVATSFTNMIDTPAEITSYAGDAAAAAARSLLSGVTSSTSVTAYQTNVADTLNAIGGISTPSQTFTLTTGADVLTGTGGNDKFIANVSVVTDPATGLQHNVETIQNVDRIDGGAGIDTFAFVTNGGTVTLPAMSNVEIISAESLTGITIDTTAIAGVTTLNVTKAAGAVAATAAAGTDITVALKENGAATALTNNVNGGKNVTVNATDLGATANADAIVVGGATAAKGNVVVNASGIKYDASADVTMGDITVTGGKTITVTEKATSDATAAGAAGTNFTVTQGAINANANADTTAIVIKQDAATDAEDAGFTAGGKTETASVKFGALKTGEAVTAAGLTLTAKADMSAAEVAAAFANLVKTSAGTFGSGDTQSGAVFAKGTYSGISSGWTSGAANGDTVVFTSNTTNSNVTDLAVTGTAVAATAAPVVTTTQGNAKNAGAADGAVGVAAGTVTIANGAALKTVSVDGYSVTGSVITGSNTLLDTLNLSNGGDFSVSNAAASLALTLNGVDGTFTQTAGAATLNVKSVGDNTANLVASTATALNVSGSGKLTATTSTLGSVKTIVVTETAGLNLGTSALTSLTSVDASATTGNVTLALDATAASYLGGKGTDIVTMTNTAASAKGIDLGDGNDTLVFAATTTAVPTGSIKGGAGTDTISLSGASAVSFSGTNTFVSKLDGFERLTINDSVATATTVNMDNMGFNYVTTSGTTSATLTLDKFVADGTVVLTAAGTVAVALKDATGSADNLNVIARVGTADLNHGTLTANSIETIKLSTLDTAPVSPTTGLATINTTTLSLAADSLTTLTIDGNANETLVLGSTTTKLATINASALTGKLTLDLTAQNGVAVSVTGGSASDVLKASIGANAHADVLVGGAGNDSLYAGSNGATLTGGAGNDLFVLSATSATTGSKEANTYSIITDFSAGDLLKLNTFGTAETAVASFAKLTASLNPATSSFSNFVNAAMEQAHAGDAVWFSFNGNSYVVVDNGVDAATFTNGEDAIVQLTGVDLTNASYNITSGTIALV